MTRLYDGAYPDGVPRALIALPLVLGPPVIGGCSDEYWPDCFAGAGA